MSAPWEIVIKMYAQQLGSRRLGRLEQYADDFLAFIEGSASLFPETLQAQEFKGVVGAVWSDYSEALNDKMKASRDSTEPFRGTALARIIRADHKRFAQYGNLKGFGADFVKRVCTQYVDELDQAETEVFGGLKIPPAIRDELLKTVQYMVRKAWIHPISFTGLVVAGMGKDEAFPGALHYSVGTVVAGKLRYFKKDEARIGKDGEAFVMPFAQRETIDTIIDGIHPTIREYFVKQINLGRFGKSRTGDSKHDKHTDKLQEEFTQYVSERHEEPFMSAVAALPRQDLAKMAEALVSLTAFVMRMSVDQHETVAEPVDVAILSKGDGFLWVKHKDLIRAGGGLAL